MMLTPIVSLPAQVSAEVLQPWDYQPSCGRPPGMRSRSNSDIAIPSRPGPSRVIPRPRPRRNGEMQRVGIRAGSEIPVPRSSVSPLRSSHRLSCDRREVLDRARVLKPTEVVRFDLAPRATGAPEVAKQEAARLVSIGHACAPDPSKRPRNGTRCTTPRAPAVTHELRGRIGRSPTCDRRSDRRPARAPYLGPLRWALRRVSNPRPSRLVRTSRPCRSGARSLEIEHRGVS
jgi:hypothetical protein